MSERVIEALQIRRNGQTQGWLFPSDSACGHTTSVAKAFAKVRADLGCVIKLGICVSLRLI
jgi:hypothetical protein